MLTLLLACVGLESVPQGNPPGAAGTDPTDTAGDPLDTARDGNNEPIADAGGDLGGKVGVVVNLDGSASYDPDGDSLNYTWSIVSAPSDSHVKLSDADQETAQLVPDTDGTWHIALVVDDGDLESEEDELTVSVTSGNGTPTASAGSDQTVTAGDTVMLNGSASSDPDGDPLSYQWTLSTRPAGSAATLSSSTAERPSFTTDVAGQYEATLVVSDGRTSSSPDNVRVVASSSSSGGGGGSSSCGCAADAAGSAGAALAGIVAVGLVAGRRRKRR